MQYVSHRFSIRAATTAETVGLPNCLIKVLRQWKSNVYHTYIKTPTCKDTMLSVSGLGHGILCTFILWETEWGGRNKNHTTQNYN